MLEETLIIWGGEFGRTPVVELPTPGANAGKQNGRDHNHYGFTMWMAGGGVKGGTVYGATDEFGFKAEDKPVHVHDLHATILRLAGLRSHPINLSLRGPRFSLDRCSRQRNFGYYRVKSRLQFTKNAAASTCSGVLIVFTGENMKKLHFCKLLLLFLTSFIAPVCHAQTDKKWRAELLRQQISVELFPVPPDIRGKLLYGLGSLHLFSLVPIQSSVTPSDNLNLATTFQLGDFAAQSGAIGQFLSSPSDSPTVATRFSPDGKHILFRALPPLIFDTVANEKLFVYDIEPKTLDEVPDAYPVKGAQWSPQSDALLWVYVRAQQTASLSSWKLGTAHPVVLNVNQTLSDGVWGKDDSVFFAVHPRGKVAPKTGASWFDEPLSIFQTKIGQQPRLVMRDARVPVPSPDGHWLAFFDTSDTGSWNGYNFQKMQSALCLAAMGSTKRSVLMKGQTIFSPPFWTPDSQHMVALHQEKETTSTQVSRFDMTSRQWSRVATLVGKTADPEADSVTDQWQPLRISHDGNVLYLIHHRDEERLRRSVPNSILQNSEDPHSLVAGSRTTTLDLLAIRLSDGQQIPIATLHGDAILDWIDEPV